MFKISKAQVLHFLTPVVFVPVSIVVSGWLMKNFPNLPHYTPDQILHEQLVVAGGAFGTALHWLHGNLWFEKNVAPVVDVTDDVAGADEVAA